MTTILDRIRRRRPTRSNDALTAPEAAALGVIARDWLARVEHDVIEPDDFRIADADVRSAIAKLTSP